MDNETYSREALRTLPPEGRLHLEMVSPPQVFKAISDVVLACKVLDAVKKSYVYGRQLPDDSPLIPFYNAGLQFDSPMPIPDAIIHGTIGMMTETGEIGEALLDAWFGGKHFDQKNAVEESGDVLWYLNRYLSGVNSGIGIAMAANIAKLFARHKVTDETAHNFNQEAYSEDGRDRLGEQIAADKAIQAASQEEPKANLGMATNAELETELKSRFELGHIRPDYRTWDEPT